MDQATYNRAEQIVGGAELSTHSLDVFRAQEFCYMPVNSPYGKHWKKNLESMGGKRESNCALRGWVSRPELHTAHSWN